MSERHSLFDTIADNIAPVHHDGYKFLAIGAGVTLLFFLLWPPLGWLGALVTALDRLFLPRPAARHAVARGPGASRPATAGSAPSSACARRPSWVSATPSGSGSRSSFPFSTCTSIVRRWRGASPVPIYVQGSFLNAAADKASEENERRAHRDRHAGRQRDRRRADRRPHRPSHRHLRQRGRERRDRPAHRPHPLRLARGCLSAARHARRSSPSASAQSAARPYSPISSRRSPSARRGCNVVC